MNYSSQEKILIQPTEQSTNIGFSSQQEQPPAYSSLIPPTQPTQPVQTTNVVYVINQPQVGPNPTTMTCPRCQATITSVIAKEPSTKTHLMCLLLCLIGCCCCAPCVYCTDSCLAKKHSCPNCNQFLGVYDR